MTTVHKDIQYWSFQNTNYFSTIVIIGLISHNNNYYCYITMTLSIIIYNTDRTQQALIGQKPMFYHSVKHRKSVFYCFSPDYLYIMKQTKKPKKCNVLQCDKTLENTRGM